MQPRGYNQGAVGHVAVAASLLLGLTYAGRNINTIICFTLNGELEQCVGLRASQGGFKSACPLAHPDFSTSYN
jgi:hypothetical protein